MTKTQALQRLFEALTGLSISEAPFPTNTSTKMVEALAAAAEEGAIGGGLKTANMRIKCEGDAVVILAGVMYDKAGGMLRAIDMDEAVPIPDETIPVPIVNGKSSWAIDTCGSSVTLEGMVDQGDGDEFIVRGDCTITVLASGGDEEAI